MIQRYANSEIDKIWSNENKLALWQETELAVILARAHLQRIESKIYDRISMILDANPINIEWWLRRDSEIRHDLNAFLDERLRFLSPEFQCHFHNGMTSYDTEEPAFARMLSSSIAILKATFDPFRQILVDMAKRYRYTIMNGRTHGQEAELQSFGKRCLTWLQVFFVSQNNLRRSCDCLKYSKLSGAIGNYKGLSSEVEKEALKILKFEPFYGATQIMPRELYAPIAQAICQIVSTLNKIALDIRLGARSGRPIYQEPFGKKQKGSSRMPHKKNTILTEQMEGMARMAEGFFQMIMKNIVTWEERSIEQSSVERVAWPDLFHVAIHSMKTMTRILQGLKVYPDNMLLEITDSCGCYAAGEAKEFLRQHGASLGLSTEETYRIVQLAAFNALAPENWQKELRKNPPDSFQKAEYQFIHARIMVTRVSISEIIANCRLRASDELEISDDEVKKYNELLRELFKDPHILDQWSTLFNPSNLLEGETKLYQEILGE